MGRVKEQLLEAQWDEERSAWESSPEGRDEQERIARMRAATEAGYVRQEKVWAMRYPAEWEEWGRVLPLLNITFDFWSDKPFDFDNFLTEVGRRPSNKHIVVRRDKSKPYQQENLAWALRRSKPKVSSIPSPYLNAEQAADYCQVAKQTIYNNRRHIERQPGIRKLLFTRESLDKWLATRPKSRRRK